MLDLWIGTWIAAGIIGVVMWGLILWAALRYKTKHNEMPPQNRYNLPMEIFYTIAPFIIIGVLFYYTVLAQNEVLERRSPSPRSQIDVVGQKWSWTFNYKEADNPAVGADVYEAGTINKTPDLYLPVNKSVRFNLSLAGRHPLVLDPGVLPEAGRRPGPEQLFDVTPNKEGMFAGKCAELCGTYHSAMLFNVARGQRGRVHTPT